MCGNIEQETLAIFTDKHKAISDILLQLHDLSDNVSDSDNPQLHAIVVKYGELLGKLQQLCNDIGDQ